MPNAPAPVLIDLVALTRPSAVPSASRATTGGRHARLPALSDVTPGPADRDGIMACPPRNWRGPTHLQPPEEPGDEEARGRDAQADHEERGTGCVPGIDPRGPGRGGGAEEEGGDRPRRQRAEGHAGPEPASGRRVRCTAPPVLNDQARDLQEVASHVDR